LRPPVFKTGSSFAQIKKPGEWNPPGQFLGSFGCSSEKETEVYFREVLIAVNCVLRLVPIPLTTAIMASAIPAAIRPYSIAVAPDSSNKKFSQICFNNASCGFSHCESSAPKPLGPLK